MTTTTSTELQTQDLEFPVKFTPAKISIGNFDEMKQKLTDYADTYKDLVSTEQTFKNDKKVRSQMRDLKKQLDSRRIAIKKDINKPLAEFEKNVKELTGILDDVIVPIDKGIKFYDQAVKDKKKQHVIQLVSDLAEQNELTTDAIQFNSKWLNTAATDKKITDEVNEQIDAIKAKKVLLDGERTLIAGYAKAVELDATGWLAMVDDGKSAAEVMKLMDKAREEAKRKAAAEAEYEAAMAKLEAEKPTVEVNNKKLDPETGEILADKSESEQAESETINLILELTDVTSEQTYLLRDFLKDNNFHFALSKGGN